MLADLQKHQEAHWCDITQRAFDFKGKWYKHNYFIYLYNLHPHGRGPTWESVGYADPGLLLQPCWTRLSGRTREAVSAWGYVHPAVTGSHWDVLSRNRVSQSSPCVRINYNPVKIQMIPLKWFHSVQPKVGDPIISWELPSDADPASWFVDRSLHSKTLENLKCSLGKVDCTHWFGVII